MRRRWNSLKWACLDFFLRSLAAGWLAELQGERGNALLLKCIETAAFLTEEQIKEQFRGNGFPLPLTMERAKKRTVLRFLVVVKNLLTAGKELPNPVPTRPEMTNA